MHEDKYRNSPEWNTDVLQGFLVGVHSASPQVGTPGAISEIGAGT